jgi:hypothetical protein
VLLADKLMDIYHLEKVAMVECRPRLQVCSVKLMDNTIKKMYLDMGALAQDVTNFVGQKIGIKITDEFGLQQDDTGEWLEPGVPLLEQFTDNQVLCLRKKFFLDDKNIDKDDPIKLHLVYTECKTGILSGTLPCTLDEAVDLGALQLQIEKGDNNPEAPQPTDLKQFLPLQYHTKNMDKQLMYGWRRLVKTPDINAKFRYVTVVRNLRTYGITMFKVQEKVPGQRKLKDALLGITRSSVVRLGLDKSIVQDWPLRQIKRWAASEGVFTLDFGNHSGEYYMVFTTEGERMSKLLSGYIDLLLKKQRDTGQVGEDEQLDVATAEDITSALAVRAVATVGKQPMLKTSTPAMPQLSIVDVRQQVERTVLQFAKMAPGEMMVGGRMDAPRFIADVASGVRMTIDDLLGGDKERAAAALRALGPLMEEFQLAYRAAAAAGVGNGVQNLAANEENLLSACKAVNEAVTRLLSSPEAMDAVAGRGGPIDRFHPAMFMIHAALAAVASQAVATSMNPVETQRLLHELASNVQLCIRDMCNAAEMLNLKVSFYSPLPLHSFPHMQFLCFIQFPMRHHLDPILPFFARSHISPPLRRLTPCAEAMVSGHKIFLCSISLDFHHKGIHKAQQETGACGWGERVIQ